MKRIFLGLFVGLALNAGLALAQSSDEPPQAPPPPAQEASPAEIPNPGELPSVDSPGQPAAPIPPELQEQLPTLLPNVPVPSDPEGKEAVSAVPVAEPASANNAAPADQKVLPLAIVRPIESPVPEPKPAGGQPAKTEANAAQPAPETLPPAIEAVPPLPSAIPAPPAQSAAPPTPPPQAPVVPDSVPPAAIVADAPAVALDPCTCDPQPGPRFWLDADYLMWWISKGPMPVPLVTTGSPNDFAPGVLGQPSTAVLMGNQSMNYGTFNGLRLNAGVALDADNRFGIEGSAFWLEHRAIQSRLQGDDNGQPFLAVPFFDAMAGAENAYAISQHFANPALDDGITGSAGLTTSSQLESWEVNGRYTLLRESGLTLDLLAGYRWLQLSEDVNFSTSTTNITPAGVNEFALTPIPAPFAVVTSDSFHTRNQFNGGQVGARLDWRLGIFSVDMTGKLAVGPMNEVVAISGVTSTNAPLPLTTVPGGIFAQTSNIGVYSRNEFAVVPEARLNFGVDLTEQIKVQVGYTFLYVSNVVRPGDQIDRGINTNLVPIDPFYTPGTGPTRPAFAFHATDLWAQGLNFNLCFSY